MVDINSIDTIRTTCEANRLIPLFAFLNGSKAYRYDNSISDNDILFVYHHPSEEYFSLNEPVNQINIEGTSIKGWDLRKFIKILAKNGWNAYECLHNEYWTASDTAFNLLISLQKIADRNLDKKKLVNTMLCCALTEKERYFKATESSKKLKSFLSFARMFLSARFLFFTNSYPSTIFEELVETLKKNIEQLSDYKVPYDIIGFLKFALYTRKSMNDSNFDYIRMDILMNDLITMANNLKNINDLSEDTYQMGYKSKFNKLLKEFLQSQLK